MGELPYENQTADRSRYLLANVLIIGAQRCIKFESRLSQLMRMLQIMIQLQTPTPNHSLLFWNIGLRLHRA